MTADFLAVRARLLGIAFRIVGSWAEAEDVVQDAWLRWQLCDSGSVANPTAFLVTVTTRLAINSTNSARSRREASVGHWAPEPCDASPGVEVGTERLEATELGLMVLLERLAPLERAAYVLRHAFELPYPQIAGLLQTSEVNARQIVSRAGRRLSRPPSRKVDAAEHRRAVNAFTAAQHGDLSGLAALVTSHVTSSRSPDGVLVSSA